MKQCTRLCCCNVVHINYGEQVGVLHLEEEVCLVPAAIFDLEYRFANVRIARAFKQRNRRFIVTILDKLTIWIHKEISVLWSLILVSWCHVSFFAPYLSLVKKRTYPAVIPGHKRFQEISSLNPLPSPGFETHSVVWRQQWRSWGPHRHVEAVNYNVLHSLSAQEVDKIHLDTANSHLQLQNQYWYINLVNNVKHKYLLLTKTENFTVWGFK